MNNHMNRSLRNWIVLIIIVAAAVFAALWATSTSPFSERPPRSNPADIELFYNVETIVSVINVTLSTLLLLMYINIYTKTRSEFTIGLIIFSTILLLHALVAIPLIQHAFGFVEFGLGPFAMLPDLFTCAALAILLYFTFR
jgi:uncharacterized membrane protein